MLKRHRSREEWLKTVRWALIGTIGTAFTAALLIYAYLGLLCREIDGRMEQLRNTKPTQFFALYPSFRPGQKFSESELKALLADQGYQAKTVGDLSPGDYQWNPGPGILRVTLFRSGFTGPGHSLEPIKAQLVFEMVGKDLTLVSMTRLDKNDPIEELENSPKRIGAFFAGRLRTQDSVALSDIPASARLAVIAIEDVRFLEHHGISVRGTLRALWQNLKSGRYAQGGSTLTQQLMKNLFFSNKKSVTRKLKEALYAFIAEQRHSKEAILEAYLNEVYLGQWGTREIHGFSEGARYYFNRNISELSLSQSATLAAIVQAPNTLNPHQNPKNLLSRRNAVLRKMLDSEFIMPDEYLAAAREPLGIVPKEQALNDVYYAIDLVVDRLPANIRPRLDEESYAIYVTLNPYLQNLASKTLNQNLERLKRYVPAIKQKEAKGLHLQGALIAVNVKDCSVLALQGGSSYRQTQFNRIIQAKRQPGSLFKPFVFLAAFIKHSESTPFTPLSFVEDSPFVWQYERQSWSPRNYDEKFRGEVSFRQALEQSLNVPTAKVAQQVGLDAIHDVIVKAGITSQVAKVPSISLGSAEVTPLELAEAYTTFASLGRYCRLRPFTEIFDASGNQVEKNEVIWEDRLPPAPTFQMVQILKGVMTQGTARASQFIGVPLGQFAGKTGTTNEYKDAWFVGFSPSLLVLVWVGYDEEKVGLSGSAAALPVWLDFVRNARIFFGTDDFVAPDNLKAVSIDRESNARATPRCKNTVTDYFPPGSEPKAECALLHQ